MNAAELGRELQIREKKKNRKIGWTLSVILIAVIIFAFLMGRYDIPPREVFHGFLFGLLEGLIRILELPSLLPGIQYNIPNPLPMSWEQTSLQVLWTLRIPRIFGAFIIGGGLAVTGAGYQGTFRNPLVSESVLGVSAGASLGAIISIALEWGTFMTSLMAFLGAISAVALSYLVSRVFHGNPTLLLVLAGIVVGSLYSAVFTWIQYTLAKDGDFQNGRIQDLLFWLMGSLANIKAADLILLASVIGICFFVIFRMRASLNVLSLGDEEAKSLGIDTTRTRAVLIICSTLIAATSVSICGMIGWVGLIVPQAVRILCGPDNRRLIPVSFLTGGIFLIGADIVSRALEIFEIPIGIVTALVGTPVFLVLLTKLSRGWTD